MEAEIPTVSEVYSQEQEQCRICSLCLIFVVSAVQMYQEKCESLCPSEMELSSHTELLLFCSAELFIYRNKSWADGQKFGDIHWSCNQEICICLGLRP